MMEAVRRPRIEYWRNVPDGKEREIAAVMMPSKTETWDDVIGTPRIRIHIEVEGDYLPVTDLATRLRAWRDTYWPPPEDGVRSEGGRDGA